MNFIRDLVYNYKEMAEEINETEYMSQMENVRGKMENGDHKTH